MKDVILLLYLKDVEYGKRLLRFLVQKKNPRLHPELVTARSKIENRVGMESEELVVLTDCSGISEDGKRMVITLSNKQDRERREIFQYQKAEGIYQELLWLLKLKPEKVQPSKKAETVAGGVYCVFSPEGMGRTALSVMLAQYMGQRGKCLYLQMSGFPSYYGGELKEEPDFAAKGVGELLFMLEREDFAEREKEMCRTFGEAKMLPPMVHFKDLLDCRPGDWERFLRRLREECGYDSIVVELGQLYEFLLDLMERGDRVLFIQQQGILGRIHRMVFHRYCQMEDKGGLLSKTRYVTVPWETPDEGKELAARSLDELAADSGKMDFVRQVLEGGDVDDDCIIDDIG